MPDENPFFQISNAVQHAVQEEKAESFANIQQTIDEFRQEILKLMLEVKPITWTHGHEISFNSEVVSDRTNDACDAVASEMFDAGFDLAHMTGSKFVIRARDNFIHHVMNN